MMSPQIAKDWATLIGLGIASVSLLFTAYNVRMAVKANRARFWLDLRDRFSRFDSVHMKLRPRGAGTNGGGPDSAEDWAQVEAYMGLFEQCYSMMKDKLLDSKTFENIYQYRVQNLLMNKCIVERKLQPPLSESWKDFLSLVKCFKLSGLMEKTLAKPSSTQ